MNDQANIIRRIEDLEAKLAAFEGVIVEVIAPIIIGALPAADMAALISAMRTDLHAIAPAGHERFKLVCEAQIRQIADRLERRMSGLAAMYRSDIN